MPKRKCAPVPCRRYIPPVLPVYVSKCMPVPVPVQAFAPVPDASGNAVHQYRYRNFGKFGMTSIPAPETSVCSVHQYRYRKIRYVRYNINTGTGGTVPVPVHTFVPVPDTWVSSGHLQYRTGHFGKFGTTSIPMSIAIIRNIRMLESSMISTIDTNNIVLNDRTVKRYIDTYSPIQKNVVQ